MSGQIVIPIPPNYTVVGSAVRSNLYQSYRLVYSWLNSQISHSQLLHRLIVSEAPTGPLPPSPPQVLLGRGENGPFINERTGQPAGIFVGPRPQGVQLFVRVENKPSGSANFVPSVLGPPFVVEKRPEGDSKEAYMIYTVRFSLGLDVKKGVDVSLNATHRQILTEDGSDSDFNDTVVTITAVQNQA
ncbi:hypothetical protein H0H93_009211 [Arthromyces matolae]|nr:hypothetical protein H0H93_009211 [Arthromyces matolae]